MHKKKGASLEIRKAAGFEYEQVDILRNIVVYFLDKFMREHEGTKPEYLKCDKCNFETKSKIFERLSHYDLAQLRNFNKGDYHC